MKLEFLYGEPSNASAESGEAVEETEEEVTKGLLPPPESD
jgi:hypothetical protein